MRVRKRIIIAGGRDFDDQKMLSEVMSRYPGMLWSDIVNGMCPTGADALGHQYAKQRCMKIHEFPADWDSSFGKKAGVIRNSAMAEFADVLIAFWDGKSRGTRDMIYKALQHGLEVHVYRY